MPTVDAGLFKARDLGTDRVTIHGNDLLQLGHRETSAIQQDGVYALAEGETCVVMLNANMGQ